MILLLTDQNRKNKMKKERLKEIDNCPYCKCRKPKLTYTMTLRRNGKLFKKNWKVICTTCGANGPCENTDQIAIESWNSVRCKTKKELLDG